MASRPTISGSEASGPAAGYYFQIRFALARALQRTKKNPTAFVSVEKLEDLAIEYESGKVDLEQLKHSLHTDKTYGDYDKALWRTLGNWSRLYADSGNDTTDLRLFLTTNGKATEGSALSLLGPERSEEDLADALAALMAAATTSTNQDTKPDRDEFVDLPQHVREAMMEAVTFVEDVPGLAALGDEIEEALGYVCPLDELSRFRNELEGWWLDRVLRDWAKGSGATVPLLEIDARVAFLRERYKSSSLTIDVDDQVALEPLDGRTFVKQIKALNVGPHRIQNAQRDFLKAGAQRSKWLREFKLDPAELDAYDAALAERWETRSAILKDELPSSPSEDDKCKCGRSLLAWAETEEVPIKNARAQFLSSGSYHALADSLRIGWHPEFANRFLS